MILSKTLAINGFLWIDTNVIRQVLFMHNFWLNEGEVTSAGAMQEVEAECRRETWQVFFFIFFYFALRAHPLDPPMCLAKILW